MQFRATQGFLDLLSALGCSLAVTAYMDGRLVLVSARDGVATVRSHELMRPMGLAVAGDPLDGMRLRLAVSCLTTTLVFAEQPRLRAEFDRPDRPCGGVFLPRAVYYTGNIDGHDLAFAGDRLTIVNTRFSCLSAVGDRHGFQPVWRPNFITALEPEDRCHLNGLAVSEHGPAYVTAFDATDTAGGWRNNTAQRGILIDVATGRIVLDGLCVPHSPRLFDGTLYMAESGHGRLLRLSPQAGTVEPFATLPGFTRGLDRCGEVIFVGLSKLRDGRKVVLPIETRADSLIAGVAAVAAADGRMLGWIAFDDLSEVFDVAVLPGMRDVVIEPPDGPSSAAALDLPGRAFWDPNVEAALPAD